MDIWRSLAGVVEVELTSAIPEESLGAISALGMELTALEKVGDLSYRFRIPRRDWRRLKGLCQKRGETLTLRRRMGIYWKGKALLKRPVLLLGLAVLVFATAFVPSRVLFIQVEGNEAVPTRQILEAAADSGIRFGASRREVRSEKMKNALLAAIPRLQWAGVNTAGCTATISVREGKAPEAGEPEKFRGIVAARDGFVLSTTVTRGNGLCVPGQAVKAGELLISPYTDCGLCLRATGAEGEIYAQTNRTLTVVTPLRWQIRDEETAVKRKISLTIGKKRINLWKDSGILEGRCGRMVSEYKLTLPGGFSLPVTLWVETYTLASLYDADLPEGADSLPEAAESYLSGQMVAGSIRSRQETVLYLPGLAQLTGKYVCTEMIGRVQQEQIGDTHGKRD